MVHGRGRGKSGGCPRISRKPDQRRSTVGCVAEVQHVGMPAQNRVNDLALNSGASAMDDSDVAKTLAHCLVDVFFHHARDLLGEKRMKVNPILDRNFYRFSHALATESCHLDSVRPAASVWCTRNSADKGLPSAGLKEDIDFHLTSSATSAVQILVHGNILSLWNPPSMSLDAGRN
jgi:hypothetical protein